MVKWLPKANRPGQHGCLGCLGARGRGFKYVTEPELTERLLVVTDAAATEYRNIWDLLREHDRRLDSLGTAAQDAANMTPWERVRLFLRGPK